MVPSFLIVTLGINLVASFQLDARLKMLDGVRFSPEQKHRELLESVIEFGLNQSRYLQEVQEKDLYRKGVSLSKRQPAHFVSVFNKQQKEAKMLSQYAYATLQASSLLSKQFMLTRQQVDSHNHFCLALLFRCSTGWSGLS